MDKNKVLLAGGIIGGFLLLFLLVRRPPLGTARLVGRAYEGVFVDGVYQGDELLPGATVTVGDTWSAISDNAGLVKVEGIEPGSYKITATHPSGKYLPYESAVAYDFHADHTLYFDVVLYPINP